VQSFVVGADYKGLSRRCNQRSNKNTCPKIPAREFHNDRLFSAWIKMQKGIDLAKTTSIKWISQGFLENEILSPVQASYSKKNTEMATDAHFRWINHQIGVY
jgi:hypothetical protein